MSDNVKMTRRDMLEASLLLAKERISKGDDTNMVALMLAANYVQERRQGKLPTGDDGKPLPFQKWLDGDLADELDELDKEEGDDEPLSFAEDPSVRPT